MTVEVQKIIWKINLKNGAGIDLPLKPNDIIDEDLRSWINGIAIGEAEVFHGSLNDMEMWISPEQFALASRAVVKNSIPLKPSKVVALDGEFERID